MDYYQKIIDKSIENIGIKLDILNNERKIKSILLTSTDETIDKTILIEKLVNELKKKGKNIAIISMNNSKCYNIKNIFVKEINLLDFNEGKKCFDY